MIYPQNYESKIGFTEIRKMLQGNCLCNLGWELVNDMSFLTDFGVINNKLKQLTEFRRIKEEKEDLPLQDFYDVRQSVARLKLKGTHMEESELFELLRSLQTINGLKKCMQDETEYPSLFAMSYDVDSFPSICRIIVSILDKYGHIKDSASSELFHIRGELKRTVGTISHTLNSILRKAQAEGLIEKDVMPTIRDGRLVLPIAPSMKRKIQGIVHDESASGRTLFIEPTAVVEANNLVRELEAKERREIIRILTEVSDQIRPDIDGILQSMRFLAEIDLLQAKVKMSEQFDAIEPVVLEEPCMDWIHAVHPLLDISLKKQNKKVVPLDLELDRSKNNGKPGKILVISGPNAGGKSVCLKTVGLLQYMMQCGLSVPISERSTMGVFRNILIDIGDEQSIEDDLSTYSSHLQNMKVMIKNADNRTLVLIDEFGTGTEPQIGGAIAEAVLKQLWQRKTWGIITTHYQNLKHFAERHAGVLNGAMLYDRHEMKALFQLQIGRPGSSFAIEIARKIGLPEDVISDASDIVGSDYIKSDKYLQDIVRDKRYWELKRQSVRQREKDIEKSFSRVEDSIEEIEAERKAILRRAKEQAEELLKEANRRIENTIREIRETEARKEETKRLRDEMAEFRDEIKEIDVTAKDALIEKKMQQILARRERMAKRKAEKEQQRKEVTTQKINDTDNYTAGEGKQNKDNTDEIISVKKSARKLKEGDSICIKGTKSNGVIERIQDNSAIVILGDMKTKIPLTKLELSEDNVKDADKQFGGKYTGTVTRRVMDEHQRSYQPDIDVRGMRGDEALLKVQHFIDDSILTGASRVRILHGKGNGILRSLIQQYLRTIPNVVSCKDENVQFGGSGITVVEIG